MGLWESRRGLGDLDARTAAVGVGVLAVMILVGVAVATTGISADRGLYRVGVAPTSPYHAPATDDPALSVRPPDPERYASGELEVLVTPDGVRARDEPKAQAALGRLRRTVRRHNTRVMRMEADEGRGAAAFPVVVDLLYTSRSMNRSTAQQSDGGVAAGGSGDPGVPRLDPGGSIGGQVLATEQRGRTPGGIRAPFPFTSLLFAFLFLVPLNFVIQAYASSIMEERVNRRGELLLVTPLEPRSIVAGKTLPYFVASIAVAGGIAVLVGGGLTTLAAVVPIALAYLATTFLGAMLARSFKELTFVTVAISVFFSTYLFVPAVFTEVHAIASISPLTLVVRDIQGFGVTAVDYLFATGPLYLSSAVLFALGTGIYREEDMFTQRPVQLKALDAVASMVHRPASLLKLNLLFLPFVLVAELLVLATLFALPIAVSLPALLIAIAVVEEIAKSVPVIAGTSEGTFPGDGATAVAMGAVSGLGFFLAEKLLVVVQVVGIPDLRLGRATVATGPGGMFPEASTATLAALALAPLALHVVTTATASLGATRGGRGYGTGLAIAVAIHAAYNLGVVIYLV